MSSKSHTINNCRSDTNGKLCNENNNLTVCFIVGPLNFPWGALNFYNKISNFWLYTFDVSRLPRKRCKYDAWRRRYYLYLYFGSWKLFMQTFCLASRVHTNTNFVRHWVNERNIIKLYYCFNICEMMEIRISI